MFLQGAITALITPFVGNHLDETGLVANIQDQLDAGIAGLVVLGSTGEAPTLSDTESELAIAITVEQAGGKVPVIVGTGSYCTRSTIEKTRKAKDLGADMALVVMPYYNKPTQEGLFQHVAAIAEAVDLPLILYNHPGRTGITLQSATMKRLAEFPSIIGVKDCSGSLELATHYVRTTSREDFGVFSGDDSLTVPYMAVGARGIISVVSNLLPREMVALTEAMLSGNLTEAQRLHHYLMPLFEASNLESNPAPIKEMMQLCGKAAGHCRLPLSAVRHETRQRIIEVLDALNLNVHGGNLG